ncbi:hypothetical protein EYR40_006757 [Pleurotus pulmonarius]|nr:hypothetical protein EYR36_011376 [Pleurotus pulmonarius]KAF4599658.1 hypothetical protein EYR40_006757 [Pleurotus pulmonarius]
MPKPHKSSGQSQLRAHSRNSSAAKLGLNLQLTQNDPQPRKGYAQYAHELNHTTKPAIPRTNSAIRAVPSKDHVPPAQLKRKVSEQTQHKLHVPNYRPNGKPKAGFMIASPADEDDEDDEDAWISTESGAVTPSGHESESDDSDAATQARTPIDKPKVVKPLNSTYDKPKPPLTLHLDDPRPLDRVELLTNGFSDLAAVEGPRRDTFKPDTPTTTARPLREAIRTAPPAHDQFPTTAIQPEVTQLRLPPPPEQPPSPSTAPSSPVPSAPSSRPASKRWSRPPSMLSTVSKADHQPHPLRPHPLIRGNSYGQPSHIAKPTPLAPLTVISEPSASNSQSALTLTEERSTSPTSMKTDTASPGSPRHSYRRTSVSSARSVATLPATTTTATLSQPWTPLMYSRSNDRQRTLSTLSTSSSSAAISSLAHLPSITRPPTPQKVSFFPPLNPYSDPEKIHPHLPPPYVFAHASALAKRTPLRESYDRVMLAKHAK